MRLSGFEVGEELGGGETRFWQARRLGDGRSVLLRCPLSTVHSEESTRARFDHEVEVARDLGLDGVIDALEVIHDGNRPVLVLAEAPGVPLDRLLGRGGEPLALKTALTIGARLAAALSSLHRHDLVHRDLRPANVFYDEASGEVNLTGLGRASRVPREALGIRAPDRWVGDPAYLAPEATGRLNRQLDYRADLYSLGVLLFEMLAGRPPFDTTDPVALVHAHIAYEPPDLAALRRIAASGREAVLPATVSAMVSKLLAKSAADRYQSGLALCHDLERCLSDLESGGEIHVFDLGERDVPERFEVPQALVGREAELEWLEEALDAVVGGRRVARLVAGSSGVGKTALVEEIRLSVLRRRGLFASGAFDPRSGTQPYLGVLNALRGLVWQKLGSRPEHISHWSQQLADRLGDHLGLLTDALPELLQVVDEPPPAPAVHSENARNRFHVCVERFLTTLTVKEDPVAPDIPVVLFLDDLQWVDAASLQLLGSLLTGGQGAFLVLGAYRDNEVGEHHLLSLSLAELVARGADVDTLRLTPLGEDAVSSLISEALHLPPTETAPLAELVYRKTAGNPFFARAFLGTLYRRRLLRFSSDPAAARWVWDLEAIASLDATENVVELVAHQLDDLPADARQMLAVASVIGKRVDGGILTRLCRVEGGRPTQAVLIDVCRQGLLVTVEETPQEESGELMPFYAFVHDRVREGAYSLLDEEERTALHLRIGRLLRDQIASGRIDEDHWDVFDVADHLNRAAHLITDSAERRGLVELDAEAGRQARSSGAFPAAFAYLSRGLELLEGDMASGDPWQESYELTRDLHAEAAEAAWLAGELEAAERLAEILRRNARNLLDAVPAYETRLEVVFARRDEDSALRLALEVLGRLGVEIPMKPNAADLEAAIQGARGAVDTVLETVAKSGVEVLPSLQDPQRLVALRILARTVLMAGWSRVRLLRFCACRLAELTATHGVGMASPLAYVLLAEVYCGELEDVAGGRRVGELGLDLASRLGARAQPASCRAIFEILVGGRTVHPATLEERHREHFLAVVESGDFLLTGACGVQISIAKLLSGQELSKVVAAARGYHAKVHGYGQLMMAHAIDGVARTVSLLLGRGATEPAPDLMDLAPGVVGNIRARIIGPEMMARFVLRQRREALDVARESMSMPYGIVPLFPFDFYRCLIFLDSLVEDRGRDLRDADPRDEESLELCMARLEKQSLAAPDLFRHKLDLVRAHAKRAAGEPSEALALYEQAIAGARENGFPHEEALARELAAELCSEIGQERNVAAYLREAAAAYGRWGAFAKVDQLFEKYPDLMSSPDDGAGSLDMTSLERAQAALASELDLDRLLRRLMTLLLQSAGARKGFLLREERQRIVVDAVGVDDEVRLPQDQTVEASGGLATQVVHFVARTQEAVVTGDAAADARFASDPHVERADTLSILCFPLRHRDRTVEIVYLENDRSPDAFSAERTAAVRLLASQAAAALENARLYRSLEQEVETRRRAEAELAALKDRLQAENVYLQEEIESHFEEIVGDSEVMRKVLYKVEQVAATDATVLILGETGTGKELMARALHRLSTRRERPLVKVNCAALPATLIESELFGHEKGAFTGALSRRIGRFELADSGTLFLDEIGDLPLDLQAKLLRVLQEGEFERLGSPQTKRVDVRILAATNRDLEKAMADGTFRSDLYYRLTVFPIDVPPLRARHGDIPLLTRHFVGRKQSKLGKEITKIPQEVVERLDGYDWPGNVRELENVVERALILSPGETLLLEDSFGGSRSSIAEEASRKPERLLDLERSHILEVLEGCGWKVKGEGNAADRLGLKPPTLRHRMKKLGIVRP